MGSFAKFIIYLVGFRSVVDGVLSLSEPLNPTYHVYI
jgi:hypothetical protein